MSTPLLRSGRIEDFRALGDTGQPAYQSADQLRMVIARRLRGKERHLARPQRDQQGTHIDWYSPVDGDITPWEEATEEQRDAGRSQLAAFQQELATLAPGDNTASGDHEVFSRLAQWVCHFPDENHVYLVGDTPVLTFWSFIHAGASRRTDPLRCLYPAETPRPEPVSPPPTPPSAAASPVAQQTSWWRRWWWLPLLLLLALLALLFGLRSCTGPGVPLPGTDTSNTGTPEHDAGSKDTSNNTSPDTAGSGGGLDIPSTGQWALLSGSGTIGGLAWPAIGGLPDMAGMGKAPSLPDMPGAPDMSGAGVGMADSGMDSGGGGAGGGDGPGSEASGGGDGGAGKGAAPADSNATAAPPAPPEGPALPEMEPLTIPEDAEEGKATFLNGDWAAAGIMDTRDSRPLKVSYTFEKGDGDMHIRRGGKDGVTCSGPVQAVFEQESLNIDAHQQANCSDDSHYEMPSVTCQRQQADEEKMANCTARYDDAPFPMELWQVK
ncbi:SrfA family protein [Vreelandella jeotgali]|uniref:SrfA family protein n=1 Tax=Vreelandella jeotgali TaxID=553386 RepID=UPI00034B5AAA|nr:SrfA family protein [Halomonas jeotgali]